MHGVRLTAAGTDGEDDHRGEDLLHLYRPLAGPARRTPADYTPPDRHRPIPSSLATAVTSPTAPQPRLGGRRPWGLAPRKLAMPGGPHRVMNQVSPVDRALPRIILHQPPVVQRGAPLPPRRRVQGRSTTRSAQRGKNEYRCGRRTGRRHRLACHGPRLTENLQTIPHLHPEGAQVPSRQTNSILRPQAAQPKPPAHDADAGASSFGGAISWRNRAKRSSTASSIAWRPKRRLMSAPDRASSRFR